VGAVGIAQRFPRAGGIPRASGSAAPTGHSAELSFFWNNLPLTTRYWGHPLKTRKDRIFFMPRASGLEDGNTLFPIREN
jgi:hypothetical protein